MNSKITAYWFLLGLFLSFSAFGETASEIQLGDLSITDVF